MNFKFTIQQMLWATFAFAFVAIAMSAAYQGNVIARGVLIAPFVMVVTFAVLAVIYWPCYFVSQVLYPPIHTRVQASFSSDQAGTKKDQPTLPHAGINSPAAEDASTGAPE